MSLKVHFLGASGTVTGSKFLLELPGLNILVDCGMFQGLKELRLMNWEQFPFPPAAIDLVLLTHGHLDHTGYLPRLVQSGFTGPVLGTAPTLAIAAIILQDSAKIHEEEAAKANEEEYTKHDPALPFYSLDDAEKALELFEAVEINKWIALDDGIKYRFQKNGHIIGAAFIELDINGNILVFSGDIGRKTDPLLETPSKPERADYLFLESTYGDRLHPPDDADQILSDTAEETLQNSGTLIIPSFAVERLQSIMYRIWKLHEKKKFPEIQVFIDSPMSNEVLEVFARFPTWHKLPMAEYHAMKKFFTIITSYKDTWKTLDDPRPKIIIAGSGMVSGGRVLTYLRYYIDKPETTVLLAGYQAEGTRGRQLLEGTPEIRIYGKDLPVKAKILSIESLSAHADQQELIDWVSGITKDPKKVFLIHGEPDALKTLEKKLEEKYSWKIHIPCYKEIVNL